MALHNTKKKKQKDWNKTELIENSRLHPWIHGNRRLLAAKNRTSGITYRIRP